MKAVQAGMAGTGGQISDEEFTGRKKSRVRDGWGRPGTRKLRKGQGWGLLSSKVTSLEETVAS